MKRLMFVLVMFMISSVSLISQDIDTTITKNIKREVDQFTNEITISSPLLKSIYFEKVINNTKTSFYLWLRAFGLTHTNGEGVIIIFDDGTKWSKPTQKINVTTGPPNDWNAYEYSAFISLTSNDLKILSTKKISQYRLYIFDNALGSKSSEEYMLYIKTIMTMK